VSRAERRDAWSTVPRIEPLVAAEGARGSAPMCDAAEVRMAAEHVDRRLADLVTHGDRLSSIDGRLGEVCGHSSRQASCGQFNNDQRDAH
jgi:hypothetical protein